MGLSILKTTPQWYAVYTRSKTEKKVEERLSLAGFNSFLPLQTVEKQWSDRKKKIQVPIINSYVFVQSDNRSLTNVYKIPGVINVLKYLGKNAIVKDSEIENLRILMKNGFPMELNHASIDLSKGTEVIIKRGPFEGLFATYLKSAGKHKIIVELEVLNSFIEVTLPINIVEEALLNKIEA